MEIYRTFLGVPLKVGEAFLDAREALMNSLNGERISWVDPSLFHVTIRFLGDTPAGKIGELGTALKEHVALPGRTRVRLTQPGSFGPRKKPRVIWVGFVDTGVFKDLRAEVDHALSGCGIPPENQPFRAHLTLGRVRSLTDTAAYFRALDRLQDHFSFEVLMEALVFYRSILGKGGPVYTPLERLDFRD